MPYTYSGLTPGGNYGDYYRGDYYRGDPFLGGLIKSIGKAVVGGVKGFVTGGPLGAITGAASAVIKKPAAVNAMQGTALAPLPQRATTTTTRLDLSPLPGSLYEKSTTQVEYVDTPMGTVAVPKRKRSRPIDPMNTKALKRAGRRIDRFTKTVRGALKHTPYQLVRRGSRGRGGSPGVITKAEAARALRR